MSTGTFELIESRVDWITATSLYTHHGSDDRTEAATIFAGTLLRKAEARGNRLRPFAMHSFSGMQCGGVSVGRSAEGYLFRLSGDYAAEDWREVHALSTNVSRLDVAATFRNHGPWRDMSLVHLSEVDRYRREHNPRLKRHRHDRGADGNSIEIGSRVSDGFGRIYDKGAESKMAFYEDTWRYEVEFKRKQALQAAEIIVDSPSNTPAEAEMASQWFRTRGVDSPRAITIGALPRSCLKPSCDDKVLRWLRSGVAGSAQRLIERGRLLEVLDALKLSASVLRSAGYVYMPEAKEE